jgi:hypothetical protein
MQTLLASVKTVQLIGELLAVAKEKHAAEDVNGFLEAFAKIDKALRGAGEQVKASKTVRQHLGSFQLQALDYFTGKGTARRTAAINAFASQLFCPCPKGPGCLRRPASRFQGEEGNPGQGIDRCGCTG